MKYYLIYEPGDHESDTIHGICFSEEDAQRVIRESTEFAKNLLDSLPEIPDPARGPDGQYTDHWCAIIDRRMRLIEKAASLWPWGIKWPSLEYAESMPPCFLSYNELPVLDPDQPQPTSEPQ